MIKKITLVILSVVILLVVFKNQKQIKIEQPKEQIISVEVDYLFGFKKYDELIETMKEWESKNPKLLDIGIYGKTDLNKDQYYLKISNESDPGKEVVLLTASIHGNEPWSTSTIMGFAGKFLSAYGKDEEITKILNSKTIYIIPVVSPDSYPNSRNIAGIDPNRNFPTEVNPNKNSITNIKNLRDFFLNIKPSAVLSGHTFGRVFLIPWGDKESESSNYEDYKRIAHKMAEIADYKYKRVCELYGHPIYGTETDWYHRGGAFAMVMEMGNHHGKPSLEETKKELNRTYDAILYFIKEAPKVKIIN